MGGRGARPGRLLRVLALLSWAAGLGVAEETPSRIPAGELRTPLPRAGLVGTRHLLLPLWDLRQGAPCFLMDGDSLPSAPGSTRHPASVPKPCWGPAILPLSQNRAGDPLRAHPLLLVHLGTRSQASLSPGPGRFRKLNYNW